MSLGRTKNVWLIVFVLSMLFAVGCGKKQVAVQPPPPAPAPPPPPPPAPTITLRAAPATIDRGGSVTLNWEARNAASVSITPEIGNVALTGNRSVSPTSSVTYTATATGPGGSTSDVARVTVNVPPPPPEPERPRPTATTTNLPAFNEAVKDVLFDYDKADIRADMMSVLQGNAAYLKNNPNVRFTIEGHCDERGSEEYNLGLGDRRANAVKEYLVGQGIPANRMMTISYGEERPVCRDASEVCFEKNRRAHFTQN